MNDQSTAHGEVTESARERYGTHATFFGVPLLTDRWGLLALFDEVSFDLQQNAIAPGSVTHWSVNKLEQFYPGFTKACHHAINELRDRKVPSGHLVYINGQVQAWPAARYGGGPSKLYPTELDLAHGGYERVIEEQEEQGVKEKAIDAELDHLFVSELKANPRALIEALKVMAKSCDERGCTTSNDSTVIRLVHKHLVPWANAETPNAALIREVLGEQTWIMGKDFA